MLLVATEDDVVQAFDATSGKELWRRLVENPVSRSSLPCGNIDPLGITGTPAIDPSTQAIYFDAAVERANGSRHEIYRLSLKHGAVLPGWPIDAADASQMSGRHFDSRIQNQRPALRRAQHRWRGSRLRICDSASEPSQGPIRPARTMRQPDSHPNRVARIASNIG
jgi:hypothetical protein